MLQTRRVPVPTRASVKARLIDLLSEITRLSPTQIGEDATIDSDLHMESVAFAEVQVTVEDEYDIEIDPIEMLELNRLGAIVDYIYERAAERANGGRT